MSIANRHDLQVVEDAAQGVMSTYKGRALGSIGDLGAYSFHETKNVISGEGGALLVNDPEQALLAEIIREKSTDRSRFFRGEVDKYTWQELGSSFLPGELIAAFLAAQLEEADRITQERLARWQLYHDLISHWNPKVSFAAPSCPTIASTMHTCTMCCLHQKLIDRRCWMGLSVMMSGQYFITYRFTRRLQGYVTAGLKGRST